MSSTYSSRYLLELMATGANANTWGTRLNQNVIDMVDEAVAGYESVDIDGLASVTLTANNGTADQSRNFGLRFRHFSSPMYSCCSKCRKSLLYIK